MSWAGSQDCSFSSLTSGPNVRFHAAQSIVVFLGLHVLRALPGQIFVMGWWFGGVGYWGGFTLGMFLLNLLSLLSLVLWILLMVKAFQSVRFKLPLAGEIAERLAGRTA